MSLDSLTERLADILARPVEPAARARAARHVLDWIGCAAIGATTPAGRVLIEHGRRHGAPGRASAFHLAAMAPASAVLVNGGLGNVLEMDDVHRLAILHPGPVVVPAALAVAQGRGASAADFLDAVVRGYEAVIRVGGAVGRGHYKFWHNTGTCGPFGAAAAAASLLGLDAPRTVWALGNAGTQMSGLWQVRLEDAMSKQLHTARAAHAGLLAAELAEVGFTGPARILEGPLGIFAATCPDGDPEAVVADPTAPWRLFDTSFKPWPACRHAHAAIDAALLLRERVPADAVQAVTVECYQDAATFCDRPEPRTVTDAKFSLQHAVAVTLLDGPPPLSAFDPPAMARTDVAALSARVRVQVTPRFSDAFPRRYGSALVATLKDGGAMRTEALDALGDPENPMSDEQIIAKARTLMAAAGLTHERIDAVVARTLALAEGGTLESLAEVLP